MIKSSLFTLTTGALLAGMPLTVTPVKAEIVPVSYSYDALGVQPGGQPQLFDAGNLKLTDGVYPISAWSDGTNVGFKDGTAAQKAVGKPSVTFDLGGLYDLTTIDIWTEEQFRDATESVTISSSTDGSTWDATTVAIANINWVDQGVTYGDKATIDVSALSNGRYFKMVFAETGQWTMLTEIDFDGTLVPEPGSLALMGLGGLCLLKRRRRG